MPWQEASTMSLREEFVQFAQDSDCNFAELCERYGISRKTGYKWLQRFLSEGRMGLADRSRRPRHSPAQTSAEVEQIISTIRRAHPAWGGRKLAHFIAQQGLLPPEHIPSPSTITAILWRQGLIDPAETPKHQAWQRFEHAAPNELWQMDFKGDVCVPGERRLRLHPLTVLDDHSRFALGLRACLNQQTATVQAELTEIFRRYGLPWRMTMDNGSPWGDDATHPYTPLTVWLVRLGIQVSHSRPYHPQTQGKDERFHRTLEAELLKDHSFVDALNCQTSFDAWRMVYNYQRPHQALGYAVPASRYRPSTRSFPEHLPMIEYGPDDQVRKVQQGGEFTFHGQTFHISKGFKGYPIGLRPTIRDGVWEVYFCQQLLVTINLRTEEYSSE
jgi:transposase InsO family protein